MLLRNSFREQRASDQSRLSPMLWLAGVTCFLLGAAGNPSMVARGPADKAQPLVYQVSPARRATIERYVRGNMRAFVDENGVRIFTNVPQNYVGKGYKEITLTFQPITIPGRYQQKQAPAQYVSSDIQELVRYYSQLNGLDEDLVYAVIRVESNFNRYAVSRAGACGLMQLMPGTAADMGVKNIFDPAQNIAGGTQYLAQLLKAFNGNLVLALAGYNAGPENVVRYGGVPPFAETQAYVTRVISQLKHIERYGVNPVYFAKFDQGSRVLRTDKNRKFVVHFASGVSQPVDKVLDEGDEFYYIQFQGQTRRVRKNNIADIQAIDAA